MNFNNLLKYSYKMYTTTSCFKLNGGSNLYLMFVAKYCPEPPAPEEPGDIIYLRNSGLRFGEICLGSDGWVNITGGSGTPSCQAIGILPQVIRDT